MRNKHYQRSQHIEHAHNGNEALGYPDYSLASAKKADCHQNRKDSADYPRCYLLVVEPVDLE